MPKNKRPARADNGGPDKRNLGVQTPLNKIIVIFVLIGLVGTLGVASLSAFAL